MVDVNPFDDSPVPATSPSAVANEGSGQPTATGNAAPATGDSQAARIIAKFGSPYKLAAAMKAVDGRTRNPSSIYRWCYPRAKGGSDGQIPTRALKLVMEAARMEGVFISSDDLYPGRK